MLGWQRRVGGGRLAPAMVTDRAPFAVNARPSRPARTLIQTAAHFAFEPWRVPSMERRQALFRGPRRWWTGARPCYAVPGSACRCGRCRDPDTEYSAAPIG